MFKNTTCLNESFSSSDFGFYKIDNLDKVFEYRPIFLLDFASLCVKDNNTLVYKRQLTGSAYRQLVIFCENNEITHVTYEHCSGYPWDKSGKCSNLVTYKHFYEMCTEASLCLSEVYIAIHQKFKHFPIYTFKNYGEVTVKFMANQEVRCEFLDQFVLFGIDGEVHEATETQDEMPSLEALKNIISDLSKMSESFKQTSKKPLTITFEEQ